VSASILSMIAFSAFVFIFIAKCAVKVEQGSKVIIERFGKFHKISGPGLDFIVPLIDRVAHNVTTKDIILDVPAQEVITRDNVVITVNAVAYITIISPEKAIYGVENYSMAIRYLIQTALRSIIGDMDLDSALSSRDHIKAKLKSDISDDISDWGITLKTVDIQDIKPSPTMQAAMEEQSAAERARRATVTRAEGDKSAAILNAEGKLEAARREAEATILLADANRQAIEKITETTMKGSAVLPLYFLLGEKYIEAIKQTAHAPNSKVILLPADLQSAIKGLMGKAS